MFGKSDETVADNLITIEISDAIRFDLEIFVEGKKFERKIL